MTIHRGTIASFGCCWLKRAAMVLCVGIVSATATAQDDRPAGPPLYSPEDIAEFSRRFQIAPRAFHFPGDSFLDQGYAPPGGYVKDFSVIKHEGRWHLFHIDGRPEERCIETGNEVSFGHASTADWQHWIRHRMPLAVGDRPWENEHVWAPFVIRFLGKFRMFYMASGRTSGGVLTYASSDDLETWHKSQDGPIPNTRGRDPFACIVDGQLHLYYTGARGIELVKTSDLREWSKPQSVMVNPERTQAESCSVHRLGDRYVLWYNDYVHVRDPSGDFRTVYIFSDDPERFDPQALNVFDFDTPLPTQYGPTDWIEKRPTPVSVELIERGDDAGRAGADDVWLVCYFRWHIDRFRLFVGAIHWDSDPVKIEEITTPERLAEVRRQCSTPSD